MPMPNKAQSLLERAELVPKLRELEGEWRAFEDRLRQEEHEIWQPHWTYGAPLTQRMLRVGYPQEAVAALQKHLEIIYCLLCGEPLSPHFRADCDEVRAGECASEVAIKQLAAIVIAGPLVRKPLKWPRHDYGVEASCAVEPRRSHGYSRFVG